MTIFELGAFGELFGAILLFISLIYVGIQIKSSNTTARSNVRQQITQTLMRSGEIIATNTDLAKAWTESYDGKVQPHQELQLQAFAYLTTRNYENIQYQLHAGMLTFEEWQGFEGNLKVVLELPFFQRSWNMEKHLYRKEFQEIVDKLLADHAPDSGIVDSGRFVRQ